jgi:uncharacterized coiled-coil protein SlyX
MFEMSEEIMRLRKEVIRLKESLDNQVQTGSGPEAPEPPPPHY